MTTKLRLILVGGGGFGRELSAWAAQAADAGQLPALSGYLDDREGAMGNCELAWLGALCDFTVRNQDRFIIGVGSPPAKAAIVASLREKGGQFARLVHPTVVLGRNNFLGEGVILAPFSMNTADTRMGDFVTLLSFSGLGHDSSAGAFTTISSHVDLMGGCSVGERVFVGSGARVMPGVNVGSDAVIGAGATVMRSVQQATTVFGPFAKRLRLGRS